MLYVRLVDDGRLPGGSELDEWLRGVRQDPTVVTIRTAALFPGAAQRFRELGFETVDTLALLRIDVRAWSPPTRGTSGDVVTARLRRRHHQAAAEVDRAAFGAGWSHDAAEIEEICRATPVHRALGRFRRTGVLRRSLVGFAIAGASGEHGYLQRLSVLPAEQRLGHGRVLTTESLRWMRRRHVRDCVVNTSVDNRAALALYDDVGFELLPECLEVQQLDVAGDA
jgi:ribosomal protein S18 acetylase RimI-like enzyme